MILMCKDIPVLNIDTMNVLNHELLPGLLSETQTADIFADWFRMRYSKRANIISRHLRGKLLGQENRAVIDKTSHALSLSDCYWIKDEDEDLSFENISPYHTKFWTGEGEYTGGAIPTLYLNGGLTKYWKDKNTIVKKSGVKEIICAKAGRGTGISVVDIYEHEDGIAVNNFTSDTIMFESAEASGKIDAENFAADDILRVFGADGFNMLFLDAVIGNEGRHAGSFGFLRNADTGEYLCMAPLFGFDRAYDSKTENDIMLKEVADLKNNGWSEHFNYLVKEMEQSQSLDAYMLNRLEALKRQSKI